MKTPACFARQTAHPSSASAALGKRRNSANRPAALLNGIQSGLSLLCFWLIMLGAGGVSLSATVTNSFSIRGTNILCSGTNWVGGGVDAFDQNGTANKYNDPIKIIREVVQDLSECPIYSSQATISNALGWLHPLQDVVNANRSIGAVTILCPFGWDTNANQILSGLTPSACSFYPQFKQRLAAMAQAFTNQPDVWIDVWNEPYNWQNIGFTETQWLSDMNDLYTAIRQAGCTNIVLIPGQADDGQETVLLDQSSFLTGKSNVLACIHAYNGWTTNTETTVKSRIQSIHNAGWALIFSEIGRDSELDCTRVFDASVEDQITSLAWSWSASDGSSLQSGGVPTVWGDQFLPYLPLYVPVTGVPPTPTSLAATPGGGQVVLAWMPSSGATSYNVKRAPAGTQNYAVVGSGITTPTYTDLAPPGGAAYNYEVTALNGSLESSPSVSIAVSIPYGCIVDDADSTGVIITSNWTSSTYTAGYYGTNYLQDGDAGGGKSVRFTPNLPSAGIYNVYAIWTTGSNRATNTPIDVTYAEGMTTVSVNQQQSNGVWVLLGTFNFNAGASGNVLIRDDGASGYVIANAVEFLSVTLAPSLAAIPAQTILAGRTLQVTNMVADPNEPPLPLTFSLVSAPAGSTINSNTGVISWRPTMAQSNTTNSFTVAAIDSASSFLSSTQQFSVTVLAPAQPTLQAASIANGVFSASVSGNFGPDYSVLVSTNLVTWQPLFTTNSPSVPFTITDTNASNLPRRFYRIQMGP
jgi:hypothetical protein